MDSDAKTAIVVVSSIVVGLVMLLFMIFLFVKEANYQELELIKQCGGTEICIKTVRGG